MDEPEIELLQFPYSHYNEKARWALDWKRVPHRRRSLLPGPHALTIRRLTGQTKVPVLRLGEEILPGSAWIIGELEQRFPDPPLFPEDAGLRERALEIQERFDEQVGPNVRLALFAVLLNEPTYVCRLFASQRGAVTRALYRASFPLVGGVMRRSMGISGPETIVAAEKVTREALDFVATQAGPGGFLVGERFSVADLTAAALLAPIANPAHPDMARPQPMPASLSRWLERWEDHAGVAWVREQYRRHRPPASAAP